jgi:hypothetical protein
MNKFQDVETAILFEMLARHTSQLTSMLVKIVTSKEYEDCKKTLEDIQSEINSRTYTSMNTGGANAEIVFRH